MSFTLFLRVSNHRVENVSMRATNAPDNGQKVCNLSLAKITPLARTHVHAMVRQQSHTHSLSLSFSHSILLFSYIVLRSSSTITFSTKASFTCSSSCFFFLVPLLPSSRYVLTTVFPSSLSSHMKLRWREST